MVTSRIIGTQGSLRILLEKSPKERGKETAKWEKQNSGEIPGRIMAALPPVLPPVPYSNEVPRLIDHASIIKLLVKMGGKFSAEDQIEGEVIKLQYSAIDEALTQPMYTHPIDFVYSSDQIPFLNTTSLMADVLHFAADLSAMLLGPNVEFERVMYENYSETTRARVLL